MRAGTAQIIAGVVAGLIICVIASLLRVAGGELLIQTLACLLWLETGQVSGVPRRMAIRREMDGRDRTSRAE